MFDSTNAKNKSNCNSVVKKFIITWYIKLILYFNFFFKLILAFLKQKSPTHFIKLVFIK